MSQIEVYALGGGTLITELPRTSDAITPSLVILNDRNLTRSPRPAWAVALASQDPGDPWRWYEISDSTALALMLARR